MPDSLQPNPLSIDAAGNVLAQGIDLPAGVGDAPPAQSRVRWIRQSDGSVVADALAWADANTQSETAALSAYQATLNDNAAVFIQACTPNQVAVAFLETLAAPGYSQVIAGANNALTIIDSNGDSNFPQLPGLAKKIIIDSTIAGLAWPGGIQTVTYNFAHGQPAPSNAQYQISYIDTAGNTAAYPIVRSPSVNGFTAGLTDPFGSPPAGTAFGLYITSILTY